MPGGPLPHLGGLGTYDDDEFDEPAPAPADIPAGDPALLGGLFDLGTTPPVPAHRERPAWMEHLPEPDSLLEGLNEPQARAVASRTGPLLVVAGAGSGKTRVLTRRIAHLIATGDARPGEILAITFTNKAAGEMRERLVDLIGPVAHRMWVSTFHAACVRILRAHADRLGYKKSFTIYDAADSRRLIEQVMRDLNVDSKKLPARSVQASISSAKAQLLDIDAFRAQAVTIFERRIADVYAEYQQRLLSASAMDFDDLLTVTVHLLDSFPEILQSYRDRFRYVLVDEFQDTNTVQNRLVLMLGAEHQQVTVVGDVDQCLPPGTLVSTPTGDRPIEDILVGDEVLGTGGRLAVRAGTVARVRKSWYTGDLVTVRAGGVTLTGTPHHIVPARIGLEPGGHFVYLMRRYDRGYRVGRTKSVRVASRGHQEHGFKVRMNQEHGDALWILRSCDSLAEAAYWEAWFAASYGLPTACFHGVGRDLAMSEEWLARLYGTLDTELRAKQLLDDLLLHPDMPHFRPQGGGRRQTINFTMFGNRQGIVGHHRIQWSSNRPDVADRLAYAGFPVRPGRIPGSFRLETARKDYHSGLALALAAADAARIDVRRRMQVGTVVYEFTPLSHLLEGSRVLVRRGDELEEVRVDEVSRQEYDGEVHDLEVDETHTYLASGLLTHNSIYSFRMADIRNILEFEEAFPQAVVVPLEQNYRSTKTILDAANAVIEHNVGRVPKSLWTDGETGAPIQRYRAEDEYDEGRWVAAEIGRLHRAEDIRYGDVAVFYRANAQSRAIENELVNARIPFKVVGGTKFYDRREVKDVLAYLRVLVNPADEVSARRIVNVPKRGVGDTSVDKMAVWARSQSRSFADAFLHAAETGISGKARVGVEDLARLLADLRSMLADGAGPARIIEAVAEQTGYRAELEADTTIEGKGRLENLGELVSAATEYDSLEVFLESVALVSDTDDLDGDTSRVSLMTLHTAKGLEFPAVFLVGMEDGVFPHLRSLDDPHQLEEERRLCYVGITRARRHLYLTHAWSRTQWGQTSHAIPSRFLKELPPELVHEASMSSSSRPDPTRLSGTTRFPVRRSWADSAAGGGGGRRRSEGGAGSGDPWDDDAHFDPDPWGDGDEGVTGRAAARASSTPARPAAPRPAPPRSSPVRAQGGPPRKSRLPKMAEDRFRQDRNR